MRYGVCTTIDNVDVVKQAEYDFIECTVVSLLPEKEGDHVRDMMRQYSESPLPVEAFNVFLPRDLKVVGDAVDEDRIKRYLETALERVKTIGAETVVFGSGGARTLPEGFSRERGEAQILQFLDWVADYADDLGITIVIEPLNTKESNIITSVPEAVQYVKKVNRKSIRALADFYHMYAENEPLENIVVHQPYIEHIHISDSRRAPGMGDYPYDTFVDCIRRAGYDGRMSIECKWHDFQTEVTEARHFLREKFDQ